MEQYIQGCLNAAYLPSFRPSPPLRQHQIIPLNKDKAKNNISIAPIVSLDTEALDDRHMTTRGEKFQGRVQGALAPVNPTNQSIKYFSQVYK